MNNYLLILQGVVIVQPPNMPPYQPSAGNYSTLTKNSNGTYTLTDKHGIAIHYDINGRLSTRTDRNGNTLNFVYNPAKPGGTYIQDAGGRQVKLYFDSKNHVTSAVDPAGHTYKYGYDANGNLVSIIDPTGAVTTYTYDSNHRIIQLTNANGHKTYYQYDSQGRAVMTSQDNNVNKTIINYDNNTVTDSLGHTSTYAFAFYGLPWIQTDPLGATIEENWDNNMNMGSRKDALGHETTFAYDGVANVIQITDPFHYQTTITYTPKFNLVSSITDALGDVTNFTYDTKGNLTMITDALGNNHSFTYDQYGNVITETDARGNTTKYTYDAYGDVLQKIDALGNKTVMTYDIDGNLLSLKDALNHTTSFQYDKLNRLLATTFADASKISFAYDLFGNQISVTDQRKNKLTKTYDAYERLIATKDPNGGVTQFNYDTDGNLLKLTDADGHNTNFIYDSDNRVLTQTNALNFSTAFTYDLVGNILTKTDGNGQTTNYAYDALNHLVNINYPDGISVANAYDGLGRKISMTDSTGETIYIYDPLSRLLSEQSPGTNNTITYIYDSEGNRLASVDQNNRTITNTYDALNRLASVTDPDGKTIYAYDAVSNELSAQSPNGIVENFTYDSLNRVLTDINETTQKVIISSFTNVYDIEGMITKKTYQDGSWTAYTYDTVNQLLSETKQTTTAVNYNYVYAYDPVGNRLSWTNSTTLGNFWSVNSTSMPPQVLTNLTTAGYGPKATASQALSLARSYNYDAGNRLTGWNYVAKINNLSFPIQTDSYTYDYNGNRTFKQAVLTGQEGFSQQTTYAYDFENRLNALSYVNIPGMAGSQRDYFTYNGDSLRTQVELNNVTANYLYDGFNVLNERNGSGNTTKSYTRGLDVGGGIGGLISQNYTANNTAVTQYYDYNDLGSPANLTKSVGIITSTYSYDAYGNLLTTPASGDTNRYLFSTKEFDSRSGLYYFGARYYDPEIGRWLTQDPLGMVDGPNTYLYVNDNPVNLIDPDGLDEAPIMGNPGFNPGEILNPGADGSGNNDTFEMPPLDLGNPNDSGAGALGGFPDVSEPGFTGPVFPDTSDFPSVSGFPDESGPIGIPVFPPAAPDLGGKESTNNPNNNGDIFSKEHTKGKRPSTKDKHTKPRPGRPTTKQRQKPGWKDWNT